MKSWEWWGVIAIGLLTLYFYDKYGDVSMYIVLGVCGGGMFIAASIHNLWETIRKK